VRDMTPCTHRPPCDGCPRYGEAGLAPTTRLTLEALAAAHGLPPPPLVAGAPEAFRTRARLAIRGRKGAPKLGLFRAGTHEVDGTDARRQIRRDAHDERRTAFGDGNEGDDA